MATQSHKARVYCSSRLDFPTRLFFRTGGHCSISSLVAALCLSKSSSACRSGQFVAGGPTRRVKNRSMGRGKQLRYRAGNTCIQQLIQQQWLCSTVDTTMTVTGVDALHLHHHQHTRARTSFQHLDRLQRREGVVGTSTRAVARAFASYPQLSQKNVFSPVKSC